MNLNVGCGNDIRKDHINIDSRKIKGVDVICDVLYLPFKNETYLSVLCSHVLEHTTNLIQAMDEIHRVLRNGGIVYGRCPHFSSYYAVSDPTHTRLISYFTFSHFAQDTLEPNRIKYGRGVFQIKKRILHFEHNFIIYKLANRFPGLYERYFAYIIPAKYIYFELRR